jgi:hypothetical protein
LRKAVIGAKEGKGDDDHKGSDEKEIALILAEKG